MRAAAGLFLLLLGLCGSVAQAEGAGLSQVGEIGEFRKTPLRDAAEESTDQSANVDIWAEVRALRDMVVGLEVELKEELTITKVHMELLQRENSAQATELTSLQTRLTDTESKTSDLEEENAAQATELMSLQTRLTATESKTSNLEEENADLQSRLSSSESELLISKSRIDQLEKEISDKPKVAFYTALTDKGAVGPFNTNITLKFSKVFTNVGKGYNPATGFFTAPVKGIYYFQFTAYGYAKYNSAVNMFKNNQSIMFNWEQQDVNGEYITNSVVFELMAGDEIHLVLPENHVLFDTVNNFSTFSGFLVSPL